MLQNVIDARLAADPKYRPPSPETVALLQKQIDDACERLTDSKARELARLWLKR